MYIDESGDLGEHGSQHIVITALLVDNPAPLDRIIKNIRRHKFKRSLRKAQEIKANNSSDGQRKYLLEKLNAVTSAKVFHMILEKKKIRSDFLKNNKHKEYNFIAGKLAKSIDIGKNDLLVRIDKSKGKQVLQEDFNQYFEKCLREKSNLGKVEIHHSFSQSWSGLQFADLLAWSAFQRVEKNNFEYSEIIRIPQEVYTVW